MHQKCSLIGQKLFARVPLRLTQFRYCHVSFLLLWTVIVFPNVNEALYINVAKLIQDSLFCQR